MSIKKVLPQIKIKPPSWFTLSFVLIVLLAATVRFYRVGNLLSPYWEEAALGYDAYSILKTGRDHHGHAWPIVAFESFGDWKPSLYFYATVPSIALFGLNTLAVRLPSVLSGLMIVIGIGLLARRLHAPGVWHSQNSQAQDSQPQDSRDSCNLQAAALAQLAAMLVAAINPWALHFSRAAWEANLATALIVWAMVFAGRYLPVKPPEADSPDETSSNSEQRTSNFSLFVAAVLLVLSMYAYHAARITAPLLGLSLLGLKLKQQGWSYLKIKWRQLGLVLLVTILLSAPLIINISNSTVSHRFSETSIFSNLDLIEFSNQAKEAAGNSFLARLFYHRYRLFARQIIANALSHFNLDFLFISGDSNPRHSVQYFGHFYHFELLFLLIGLYQLFTLLADQVSQKNFEQQSARQLGYLLCLWLVFGLLPAALTKTTPHALRTLPMMPVMILLVTLGLIKFVSWASSAILTAFNKLKAFKFKKSLSPGLQTGLQTKLQVGLRALIIALIIGVYGFSFSWYWHFYTQIYPQKYSQYWQAGYQRMVQQVQAYQQQYAQATVYISRSQGRPAMFYWFYTQTDPRRVQAQAQQVAKDQGEFLQFEQIRFVDYASNIESHIESQAHNSQQAAGSKPVITAQYQGQAWQVEIKP